MACKFSEEHRLRIIQFFYQSNSGITAAARRFNTWRTTQPNPAVIPLCTVRNVQQLVQKFQSKKTIQMAHKGYSGRRKSATTEEKIFDVMREMDGARTSLRRVAVDLGMSLTSVYRIAKEELHLHAYRTEVKHGLVEADYVQRVELCRFMLQTLEIDNPTIVFVDEATFRTDGTVNLWNDRHWSTRGERPDIPPAGMYQSAKRTTVLAAVARNWLGGPYFFPRNVDATSYRDVLEMFLLPDLRAANLGDVWFLQDGAPAHTAAMVRDFLVENFGRDRLIGRYFDVPWPSRSPDLNPVDYFFWGFVRDRVFSHGGFVNVTALDAAIVEGFNWIRANRMDAVQNAVGAFFTRLSECIESDGRQLRHK